MIRIPLFPLPGVVLLPGTLLPLHIFEPRYRAMIKHALAGDRTVGIALLAAGADPMESSPPIHPIGGAGRIVEAEELEDGRYNIVLEGRFRYRVITEEPPAPYRLASVEPIPSVPFVQSEEEEQYRRVSAELFDCLRGPLELPPLPDPPLPTERLCSELAVRLRYAPADLQTLLETDSIRFRLDSIIGRMRAWRQRMDFLAPFRPAELDARWN